jgi:hypothetical protein
MALLVLLAGCSGLVDDAPTADTPDTSDGDEVRYGIAVGSQYGSNHTFGVRARAPSGSVVLNHSRQLEGGERWHVANLSAANYRDEEYELLVFVDGERSYRGTFSFREPEGVTRKTGATLVVLGGGTGSTHACAGNVTCYRQQVGS